MSDDTPWMPPSERPGEPSNDASGFAAPAPAPTPAAPLPPAPAPVTSVPPPPGFEPDAESFATVFATSDQIAVEVGEPPRRARRSKWIVTGAAAAVVATGAAGVFAVSSLTGPSGGGAETPEELGLALLQAIEDEDVLGVVDVLLPGERNVFRDPLVDLVAELTRLEVLTADADLSRILGIDVEFSNELVTASSTNVDDISNIDLRADAVVTVDGAELPIGALVTDNLDDDTLTEMRGTTSTEADVVDVRLTAVEHDGRWYFSVFHTVAELARADLAPGSLIPIDGIGAAGADTPEAAFDGVLDRVEALDLTGLLQTLNPGEAAALQRYAPLFLDDAEEGLDEIPLVWEITRREFRVEETDDAATVFVDALAIDGSLDGDSFTVEFADGCVRAEAADESIEQCIDRTLDDTTGLFDGSPELERLVDTISEAFADIEDVGVELRRTDDRWYVSPVGTVTEGLLTVLRALDRSELDAIVDQARAAESEFGDAIFGGLDALPLDDGYIDDEFADDEFADDEFAEEPGAGSWEECFNEPDAVVATECFQTAVDSGEIDESFIPVVLRFPECGYQASWESSFYSAPDAEFIAAAEAARPCFLALVESGEVTEFELPNEITALECFEGRNWYNVFDDPDYDERYYACLDGLVDG